MSKWTRLDVEMSAVRWIISSWTNDAVTKSSSYSWHVLSQDTQSVANDNESW